MNSIVPGKLTALAKAVGVSIHYFFDAPEPDAPTLPLAMESHRKLLHVVQALRQIEQRHPEVFPKICSMVTAIAKAKQPDQQASGLNAAAERAVATRES